MTIEQVKERVERIRAAARDDEAAHSLEDALHEDVLVAIAAGAPDASELAREALMTRHIDFARWCA
jgi:electron transfer flavoprotein alpha/beta subunit